MNGQVRLLPGLPGLVLAVLFILAGTRTAVSESLAGQPPPYLFGVVPQYSAAHIVDIWRPLLDALEHNSGLRFRLAGSDSIPAFEKEFAAGRFDFVYMNPYHFVHAERSQGYQPLVRDVGRMLQGIIVVHKDSSIRSIEQLQGQIVAFPAPNALGASLMPRAELQRRHQIRIEPRYVSSHSSVYLNVALGKAAAGGGVQKTLEQQPQELQDVLRVIYHTQSFLPHPVAAHPRVAAKIRARVKDAFLALGTSEQNRQLLARVPIKQIGAATSDDYRPLLELSLESFYETR